MTAPSAPPADPLLSAVWRTLPGWRDERDVFQVLRYVPNCRAVTDALERGDPVIPPRCGRCPQEQFHTASEYDVAYGGAAGGGKTRALVMDDLRDAIRYPGIRISAYRRTYDELEESLLKELRDVEFAAALGGDWNETKRELRFPNRSVIRYRYADTADDATKRQGGEYQKLTIDERTLMRPGTVDLLTERLRSGNPRIPVIGIRSGFNPGGIGHMAVRARFVDGTDHGRQVIVDGHGFTVRFIPARVDDNPHVDAGYRRRLEAIPDPKRRAAMLDGDWDQFEGQFFSTWRRDRHIVPPFIPPLGWARHAGIDYGYAAPWCVLWLAVDADGRVWVYREVYATQVGEQDQARLIQQLEGAAGRDCPLEVVTRHADPSMWSRTGSAPSPAQAYTSVGVQLLPAVNDRIPGWQRVRSYLADGPACPIHRAQGWVSCPMLHVMDGAAPNLVRTLPAAPHSTRHVEDLDTASEDHALDALRYGLMGLAGAPAAALVEAHRPGSGDYDLLTVNF